MTNSNAWSTTISSLLTVASVPTERDPLSTILDKMMVILFAALAISLLWKPLKRRLQKHEAKTPEDQRIMEIAMELCRRLNIKFPPKTVVFWNDSPLLSPTPAPYWSSWSDYCFIRQNLSGPITIEPARRMKGRLDPEEWRPLMAASFIFQFKKWKMAGWYMIIRMFLPLVAWIVETIVFGFTFTVLKPYFYTATSIAGVLVCAVIFFSLLSLPRRIKNLMLMADVEAAELVGKEALLHSLRKIDELGLEDLERLKGSGLKARFWWRWLRPSVPERIENLLTPKPAT